MSMKKALSRVAMWAALALAFNAGIFILMGRKSALEFLGGYVVEFSLSLDNLFLFLVIFSSFGIPPAYQRRALNYGIAGAVVLRFTFILLGSALVASMDWILYVFGGILLYSGTALLIGGEKERDYRNSRVMGLFARTFPFTGELEGERFFVRRDGKLHATLLFGVLVLVETSDIIFAVDSIPAIFSITLNPFIVFSSNIFAILGLRSLYFVIEKLAGMFRYVKYGVAAVLLFTGVKLCILIFGVEIPILLSIGIIAGIITASILASAARGRAPVGEAHRREF